MSLPLGQSGVACYPIDLESQARWHAAQMRRPPSKTAVFVAARPARPDEVRRARAVGTLRKKARAAGWQVNVTYAKGLPASGSHVVESLAVRMRYRPSDDPRRPVLDARALLGAVAVYSARIGAAYSFDYAWFWVTPKFPVGCNSTELAALMAAAPHVPADPQEAVCYVIDRHADIREAAKAKAAVASAKAKATREAKKVAA